MTYDELIESIKKYRSAEEWVYNYPKDIETNGYSYFQDAALEIAVVAYAFGKKESFDNIEKIESKWNMGIKFDEEDAQAVLEYFGIGGMIEKEKESEYKNGFEDGLRFVKNII